MGVRFPQVRPNKGTTMYPVILSAKVDFGPHFGGTYELSEGGISGKPCPSEGEAWSFRRGVEVMNKFMFMSHTKQLELLKQLDLT